MTGPSLVIHRSAHEIGGNCIEIIASGGQRLLLDAGRPLWAKAEALPSLLPGTLDTTRGVAAVLISHPHLDHWGLLGALPADWPVWCGAAAAKLIQVSAELERRKLAQSLHEWKAGQQLIIGPFTITPHLVDHSAFDAHMLQVEVDGKRVLYSGDFRRHGRKAALVDRLMAAPPRELDVLLVEGTNLGRNRPQASEESLVARFAGLFRRTRGRVFVSWSAQNVDRTVTLYKACLSTGRTLVVDLYTAEIMHLLATHARLPDPGSGWPNLRVLVTGRLRRLYRHRGLCETVDVWARDVGMSARGLQRTPGRWVVAVRPSMLADLQANGVRPSASDAWSFSQWQGYLQQPSGQALAAWFAAGGAPMDHIHTSGHATPADLHAFVAAMGARTVVPIHGEHWDEPAQALPGMRRLPDGVAWAL